MKIYVEGFRGPWGWRSAFYEWVRATQCEHLCVEAPEDADVIFQCDPGRWPWNHQFLGKKKVIANVLDYAHWVDGNPDIENYTREFVAKADLACGICQDVLDRMIVRGIKSPQMFYYPSQVSRQDVGSGNPTKKKRFISVGRFGDPGKRIEFAVNGFYDSGLASEGWNYILVGPEAPPCLLPKGVSYIGYMDREPLMLMIKGSHCLIQPEPETGLGLPSIEAALLWTPFAAANRVPMSQIWDTVPEFLFEDQTFSSHLTTMAKCNTLDTFAALSIANEVALPWLRENAFISLIRMCESV